jgi:peptidoglycan/xylan/chitin deacetylase (PgdA/CDA1 family)
VLERSKGGSLPFLRDNVGAPRRALMLHSVAEPLTREEGWYYIAPRRFHRLMRWLNVFGYKTATTAEWMKNEITEKHVLFTFDDGYDDLYTELLPLVIEHRYTAIIYLVAGRIGETNVWDQESGLRARNLMTLDQLREMQKYGIEFGSHTMTHPWLPHVTDERLRKEVTESKYRLEDLFGIEMTSFAYPFGGVDERVRSAVGDAGYKLAFTIESGPNLGNDPLCQKRAEINNHTTLTDFAFKLRNGRSLKESIHDRYQGFSARMFNSGP